MARGDFFSPNRKVSGKDKQVASSMSGGSVEGHAAGGFVGLDVDKENKKHKVFRMSIRPCLKRLQGPN